MTRKKDMFSTDAISLSNIFVLHLVKSMGLEAGCVDCKHHITYLEEEYEDLYNISGSIF
jgi:hypothetical protein